MLSKTSGVQSSPLVQRSTVGDIFDSATIGNEALLSHFVFKFISIKLGKAPLLGEMGLLATRALEPGPV